MKPFYFFLLLFITSFCYGQKIPEVQNTSLKVPNNIKIDGKINEWASFAAANKRTDLTYSLANDNDNLYLVIKSLNNIATNKILAGGISFTINTLGKKKEEGAYTLTYPIVTRASRAGNRGGGLRQSGFGTHRAQQTEAQKDSISFTNRKTQLSASKEIKLKGFSTIPDSLISIYNEYGIKVATSIDFAGVYIYEMAIPLKYLDLNVETGKELAYQIKLNGMNFPNFGGGNFGGGRGNGGNFDAVGNGSGQDLLSPTDFWGKYILFKN